MHSYWLPAGGLGAAPHGGAADCAAVVMDEHQKLPAWLLPGEGPWAKGAVGAVGSVVTPLLLESS